MNWLGPIPGSVVAIAAAVSAVLVVVAYIIKMRRRRFEVPFSNLWKRVLEQRDANSLWKQLKRWLSLAFLLAIVGLLLVAALGPTMGARDPDARSVVVLIDASASMKAQDGDKERKGLTRMERAKERAKDLVDSMGGGDLAMIMRVDGQATPLTRFDGDKPMLKKVIHELQPADTPADLPRALSAAADALRGRQKPLVVIISDGAYSEQQLRRAAWGAPPREAEGTGPGTGADNLAIKDLAAVDLGGIDVRYLGVGSRSENVGIVAFNVRRYIDNKAAYEVFIEVQNFGTKKARRQLALYNGESAIEVKSIELTPGQRIREIYRELPGGSSTLRASLRPGEGDDTDNSDPFPLDDQAWALMPEQKMQHVLVVWRGNRYLEEALKALKDSVFWEHVTPEQYDADPAAAIQNNITGRLYDAVLFDDHTPAVLPPPPVNVLLFHPTGEHSPFATRGTVATPRINEVDDVHPVMRWVELADANFLDSLVFAVDKTRGDHALAYFVRDPLIVARRENLRKLIGFGFSLTSTDLPMRVAFPLLLVNTFDWFAGDDGDLVTTYTTGQRFRIPLDGLVKVNEVTIVDPAGRKSKAPVVEGMATFYGSRVGIHQILAFDPDDPAPTGTQPDTRDPIASFELAANLGSTTESKIAPATDLVLGGKKLEEPGKFGVSARRDLWTYLVLAVVLLLLVEWVTYHRRITV
ncbi:MAG TPA: BatA and WFA domain-containing protein [Kofleriaceae bacterium]|nr:BatA and WFA domain-containing protein [Kofleriaceae bacterium]